MGRGASSTQWGGVAAHPIGWDDAEVGQRDSDLLKRARHGMQKFLKQMLGAWRRSAHRARCRRHRRRDRQVLFAACAAAGTSLPGGEMLRFALTDEDVRMWGWTALNYVRHINAGADTTEARYWLEKVTEIVAAKAKKATLDYLRLERQLAELRQREEGSK